MKRKYILLTWLGTNTDPYVRQSPGGIFIKDEYGAYIWGPNLTLLFDENSDYCDRIHHIIFLNRDPKEKNDKESKLSKRVLRETKQEIKQISAKRNYHINIEIETWDGTDPTDHKDIFMFISSLITKIREKYSDDELLIHISPGTPAMHTIWILMAETGYITPPFKVLKTYRKSERKYGKAVGEVHIDIDTFYKVYQKSWPNICLIEDENVYYNLSECKSDKMLALREEARRVAKLNVPVLIYGERGTGKTTLANWVRSNSSFRKKELDNCWPAVACGQFTNSQLIQAELFGYIKGSFTGAVSDKIGLIEKADGDTLFLDEVGDIDRDLQRLLIKAIEEKQFYPLGSDTPRQSNFRLITATNRSIKELREHLDSDFFDRITVFMIYVPPLREVPEDIPALWKSVLQRSINKSGVKLSKKALTNLNHEKIINWLLSQPLYGNLRDINKVAFRLIAALNDNMDQDYAITYACNSHDSLIADQIEDNMKYHIQKAVQDIVNSYRKGETNKISTESLVLELKKELAIRLTEISKETNISIDDISDITSRTCFNWIKIK